MLNQAILVGRLVKDVEIEELEDGKKVAYITIATSRPTKNTNGVYEYDIIDCKLLDGIAENTAEYCKKGDIIGIKGRLQSSITSDDGKTIDENKEHKIELFAEKVTFLSTAKKD